MSTLSLVVHHAVCTQFCYNSTLWSYPFPAPYWIMKMISPIAGLSGKVGQHKIKCGKLSKHHKNALNSGVYPSEKHEILWIFSLSWNAFSSYTTLPQLFIWICCMTFFFLLQKKWEREGVILQNSKLTPDQRKQWLSVTKEYMSSEESGEEDCITVHPLPWRSQYVTQMSIHSKPKECPGQTTDEETTARHSFHSFASWWDTRLGCWCQNILLDTDL